MNPGTVTQSQCVAITSINYTARYMAFGGTGTVEYSIGMSQTTTMDDVMTTESFDGHMFTVDMSKAMSFGGMPNVLAGTYSYMLNAADSYDPAQEGSREWALAVTSRELPQDDNVGDFRDNDGLYGFPSGGTADQKSEATNATAGDWAGFVPAGFEADITTTIGVDNPAVISNVPRLRLPGEVVANPAGLGVTLNGEINSANDVDVFWLGALAPNWKLELKVVGTSVVSDDGPSAGIGDHNEVMVELRQMGVGMVEMESAADPSYDKMIGGLMGGLTCGDYYVQVKASPTGGEGTYTLAWRLSRPVAAAATP